MVNIHWDTPTLKLEAIYSSETFPPHLYCVIFQKIIIRLRMMSSSTLHKYTLMKIFHIKLGAPYGVKRRQVWLIVHRAAELQTLDCKAI